MRARPTQQQPSPTSVSSKDLPPAHQASMPQSQVTRSAAAYQPTTYNSVTAQVTNLFFIRDKFFAFFLIEI